MEAVLKTCNGDWKSIEGKEDASRTDGSFTEIFELISHNKTMVKSEWDILLQLVQKKQTEKVGAPPFNTTGGAY